MFETEIDYVLCKKCRDGIVKIIKEYMKDKDQYKPNSSYKEVKKEFGW